MHAQRLREGQPAINTVAGVGEGGHKWPQNCSVDDVLFIHALGNRYTDSLILLREKHTHTHTCIRRLAQPTAAAK